MFLSSTSNEKVKYWLKLKQKKYRDQEKLFLIEDDHLINEAIKNNLVKELISLEEIETDLPLYIVTDSIMKQLSDQVTSAKMIAVCNFLEEKEIVGNIIILDDIQDPGNLGTIIRSAVAFNFATIVLSNNSVSMYNPKVIRASEGMIFNINIIKRDLKEFINSINNDYLIISTDISDGEDIRNINNDKIALVIGNEGNGVSKEIEELCHKKVNIKMNDNCESLNAGICASILMYEVNHG